MKELTLLDKSSFWKMIFSILIPEILVKNKREFRCFLTQFISFNLNVLTYKQELIHKHYLKKLSDKLYLPGAHDLDVWKTSCFHNIHRTFKI